MSRPNRRIGAIAASGAIAIALAVPVALQAAVVPNMFKCSRQTTTCVQTNGRYNGNYPSSCTWTNEYFRGDPTWHCPHP
jgi:hypothetical protein